MTWILTAEQQAEALRDDIEALDREIRRTPDHRRVVDWQAVLARKDRLRRDRERLAHDLELLGVAS